MKKISIFSVLVIVIMLFASCNTNNAIPTYISLEQAYKIVPTRIVSFKNSLSCLIVPDGLNVSADPHNIKDPHILTVNVALKNISSSILTIKRPITWGFFAPGSRFFNELHFTLKTNSGSEIMLSPTSNYPSGGRIVVPTPPVTSGDFIQLQAQEVYSFNIELPLPLVSIAETGYSGNLPSGRYQLNATYGNLSTGYQLPLTVTPPAVQTIEEHMEWINSNTVVVDQNAWVGEVSCATSELVVP